MKQIINEVLFALRVRNYTTVVGVHRNLNENMHKPFKTQVIQYVDAVEL